jgi:hypothetical protein
MEAINMKDFRESDEPFDFHEHHGKHECCDDYEHHEEHECHEGHEHHSEHECHEGYEHHGGFGFHGVQYVPAKEISRASVEEVVKNVLANAKLGEKFVDRRGYYHTPIVVNSVLAGILFEDFDLASLKVGGYWIGRVRVKVELVKDGNIVGFVIIVI